jgi:uncharacterized protein DUF3465
MARSRSRRSRRPPRPPRPPAEAERPRPVARPPGRPAPVRWWRARSLGVRAGLVLALALTVLAGVNLWLRQQPPRPDANAVHADIQAGRSGAEVTFVGTLVRDPTISGGHQRMLVRDRLGDTLELDYNTDLGPPVPVHRGASVTVHGELYLDPGQAGVHCLHARTSRGCPEPGWVRAGGTTYS